MTQKQFVRSAEVPRKIYLDAVQISLGLCVPGIEDTPLGYLRDNFISAGSEVFEHPKMYYRATTDTVWLGKQFDGRYTLLSTNGAKLLRILRPEAIRDASKFLRPRLLGAEKNLLSSAERCALENLRGDDAPWLFQAKILDELMPKITEQLQESVLERVRQATGKVPRHANFDGPVVTRAEFYFETPTSNDPDVQMENIRNQITRISGGPTKEEKELGREAIKKGLRYSWTLDQRRPRGEKRVRNSSTKVKLYGKGDVTRIEMSCARPLNRHDASGLSVLDQIVATAERSLPTLAAIDEGLAYEIRIASRDDLLTALANCGVRAPAKKAAYLELVAQISSSGVYDSRIVREKELRLSHSDMSKSASHPDYGILVRRERRASNGASQTPLFELREDWRERAETAKRLRSTPKAKSATTGQGKGGKGGANESMFQGIIVRGPFLSDFDDAEVERSK